MSSILAFRRRARWPSPMSVLNRKLRQLVALDELGSVLMEETGNVAVDAHKIDEASDAPERLVRIRAALARIAKAFAEFDGDSHD